ncbi:MAG: hypothetical protein ACI9JM_000421 [Halioglobus sp.]|jgi:hypothetical protein
MRLLWKHSVVITVPVSIIFLLWVSYTYALYKSDRFHFGSVSQKVALLSSGQVNFVYLLDFIKNATLGGESVADINVYVDNNALKELNYDLPYSGLGGENYKPAHLLYPNGELEKVQLRYRGDSANHWLLKEKSYRIKTRKKKLWQGMRQFNLIAHETGDQLGPHMAYKLAEVMGLLGPKSELLTMNVNGRTQGPKLFVEQIDESFLRRRGIMPGDIYAGDNVGNGRFRGIDTTLFESSLVWEKAAANNHYDLDSKIPLQTMITDLENNTFSTLDLKQFGAFAAYTDLIRSRHQDDIHNWKLQYDHYRERFAPLVWDSIGWYDAWVKDPSRSGIAYSMLMKKLFRNHEFLYARQIALIDFYNNHLNEFSASLETQSDIAKDKVKGLDYFIDVFRVVRNKDELLQTISNFNSTVHTVLQEVKEATVDMDGSFSYAAIDGGVRLSISELPISSFRIDLKPGSGPTTIAVRYKSDGALIERDLASRSERRGDSIFVRQRLIPASVFADENHRFSHATYDLLVTGIEASAIVSVSVTPMTVNVQEVRAQLVDLITQSEFRDEYSIIPETRDPAPIIFSGTKIIEDFQTIKRDLIIEPGTRLVFSEGAGLKVFGKISAIGTPEAPITFTAADPEAPWGALVVKDHVSDGSRFEHCLFEDGSGIKGDIYEYTAMLSIHNASNILIKNSIFRDSHITDDMLHVVYGDIKIVDSLFENSRADAIDLDITTAEIIGSRFIGSGNDAVDLMSSKVLIRESEMTKSGDKGVSVGEDSLLFLIDSRVLDNHVGIQSKDSSHAVIFNSLLRDNDIGIHTYQKNWQYGTGGKLTIGNSVLERNHETAAVGDNSEITILDSYVDKLPKVKKRLTLHHSDSEFKQQTQSGQPLELDDMDDYFTQYLSLIDTKTRGIPAASRAK